MSVFKGKKSSILYDVNTANPSHDDTLVQESASSPMPDSDQHEIRPPVVETVKTVVESVVEVVEAPREPVERSVVKGVPNADDEAGSGQRRSYAVGECGPVVGPIRKTGSGRKRKSEGESPEGERPSPPALIETEIDFVLEHATRGRRFL